MGAAGTFANKFLDWCPFMITVEPFTGVDAYGQSTYGAGTTYQCQIEDRVRMVRDVQGQERASTSKVYVIGGPIDPRDRITMPNTFKGPTQPPILAVSNLNDKDGFSHSEVYL